MRPSFSTFNHGNKRGIDAKHGTNLIGRMLFGFKHLFNLNHLFSFKFGHATQFAFSKGGNESSFLDRITIIVPLGSKEQMSGIHASAIVSTGTVVKGAKAVRNGSIVHNPTCDMRPDLAHIIASDNLAISSSPSTPNVSSPNPAGFGLSNLFPKAFREVQRKALLCEVLGRNFLLHNVNRVLALCRVPGHTNGAGTSSFSPETLNFAT